MKPLKVGVVGAGVGRLHVRGYQALPNEVEIVALCDVNEARLQSVADDYNIPLRFTDSNELFTSGEVEAVSICLPNSLHAPASVAALEAGLHVLCEKPLAENSAAGQKIVQAVAKAKTKFMICYNRRYRPDVIWMKQAIDADKLGKVYRVKAGWVRETGIPAWTRWFTNKEAAGGGPLIDLGVHMLDAVMWLLDYPKPLTVSADVQANFGPLERKVWLKESEKMKYPFEVEDMAAAFIRLAGGISLSLETSWASHNKPGMDDFYITLLGTEGSLSLYVPNYAKQDTLTFYTEVNGTPVTVTPKVVGLDTDHTYAVAEFVKCIREGTPPAASAQNGLVIMNMIGAVYQSARDGREVVLG